MKRRVIVDAEDAAALLVNPRALHFFAPFMLRPQSLTSVADWLGTTPSAVAYWVPQFRAARLIEPVQPDDLRHQRGKWYRSRADEYLLPIGVLPAKNDVHRVESARRRAADRFYDSLAKAERDGGNWGMSVSVVGDEVHLRGAVPHPDTTGRPVSRTLDGWLEMRLTRTQAKQLKNELLDVLERYRAMPMTPRTGWYIVHVGVAPTDDR